MRITNNTMTNNFLNSLNKSLQRESNLQEQLADGKIIHRPSDDPIKAVRSLRYNTSLALNAQYTQNAQDAQSWMETSDSAMSDLSSIMTSIKEKVVQASNGTNPQDAVQAIGADIDGLINQAVTLVIPRSATATSLVGNRIKLPHLLAMETSLLIAAMPIKFPCPFNQGQSVRVKTVSI